MMPRRPSGTGILPVRIETHRRDARATKNSLFRLSLLLSALFAVAAMAPPSQPITLPPEQAAKEGRALVDEMLSQPPDASTTTGVLAIRSKIGYREILVDFQTTVTSTNWLSDYKAHYSDATRHILILHTPNHPNTYTQFASARNEDDEKIDNRNSAQPVKDIWAPFAGSDFSIADLGLEFLHWPDQKLLQKEMKRSRSCRVLESTNPNPAAGGYAKVKSWVDNESHGILLAQAFDAKGNKLKEFAPGDFSKSKTTGQWQLGKMQISNFQTDSSTTVRFDVDK